MKFSQLLISWYNNNGRDLPWRRTNDLYHIWVSEIILQQTRVNQGMQYYHRFLERFPDIKSLALADETEVLKIWQGLGYYSRARNMHTAAKQVINDYDGVFPSDYNTLIKIKGIGSYTAAALLSIGYNLPYPVIDGNVKRIMSRFFAIEIPINTAKAENLIVEKIKMVFDYKNPALFNQAIMDFGALHCKPGQPDCATCIFNKNCIAFNTGQVLHFPKTQKKQKLTKRHFYYIVATHYHLNQRCTFLVKRNGKDIWKNLFEFPLIEMKELIDVEKLLASDAFKNLFPASVMICKFGCQINLIM